MGFPDGFTHVVGLSDNDRHRLLGNSVSVPVIEQLLARINLQLNSVVLAMRNVIKLKKLVSSLTIFADRVRKPTNTSILTQHSCTSSIEIDGARKLERVEMVFGLV